MHHLPHNWPRPDDGHLHDEIVEAFRVIARQRGHLRAALDLEHAHRVGLLQHAVDFLVLRQLRQVHALAVVLGNQFQAILEDGHHAQPQQVHFDNAEVRATGHGRAFQRYYVIQLALADDHAARVLAEVTGQILNAHAQLQILGDARMLDVEARVPEGVRHGVVLAAPLPVAHQVRQPAQRLLIEPQRFARLARR